VQDLWKSGAAGGLGHCGGGKPAGVQQVRPGLRRGDAGSGEAHRRTGGLCCVEGVRRPEEPPRCHRLLSGYSERQFLPH